MVGQVKFTIDKNGEVSIDVQGTKGSDCDKLTEPFERLLGTVAEKDRKDSFYETSEETTTIEQKD